MTQTAWFAEPWAPLVVLGTVAAAMAACLHLFVTLKRKIQALDRAIAGLGGAQKECEEEWRARTAAVEDRLLAEEQRAAVLVPPTPPRSGINLNKRTHVIRLARRGEPAGTIASTLQLPRAEVELLLKVDKLASEAQRAPSAAPSLVN